ncbi:MAG: cell wall metabolism sensor histidine kinase WalK, partial [Oscillospiraceae bacterium]|nr:cell wall metabolism sensor histidine kinase WalK [Oscillospiraceae bacterium]
RHKIFERFYRSDESRSRETGGYGVGLSIAASIADAHSAKITVSGEHGHWIRFDVAL